MTKKAEENAQQQKTALETLAIPEAEKIAPPQVVSLPAEPLEHGSVLTQTATSGLTITTYY